MCCDAEGKFVVADELYSRARIFCCVGMLEGRTAGHVTLDQMAAY